MDVYSTIIQVFRFGKLWTYWCNKLSGISNGWLVVSLIYTAEDLT